MISLELQACALWVREYLSVNCVFCHSIKNIKIRRGGSHHRLDMEGVAGIVWVLKTNPNDETLISGYLKGRQYSCSQPKSSL